MWDKVFVRGEVSGMLLELGERATTKKDKLQLNEQVKRHYPLPGHQKSTEKESGHYAYMNNVNHATKNTTGEAPTIMICQHSTLCYYYQHDSRKEGSWATINHQRK